MQSSQVITNLSDQTLATAADRLSPAQRASVMRAAALADDEIVEAVLPTVLGVALENDEISIRSKDIVAEPGKVTATRLGRGRKDATTKAPRQPRKATPSKTAAGASGAPKATKTKGVKREPAVMAAIVDKVEAHIKANPGQGVEEIGRALNMKTKELTRPIQKLLEAKKITSRGQKRATRYFPAS